MPRRIGVVDATAELPPMPAQLASYDESDWVRSGDLTNPTASTADLLTWTAPQRVQEIIARGRWGDARRRWADDHGVSLRDYPRTWGRRN